MKNPLFLFALLCLLCGCGSPELTFTPGIEANGHVAFRLGLENADGFLRMMLWEKKSRRTLWDINLNYYRGPVLKYGEIPSRFVTYRGSRHSAWQKYPKTGLPQPIPTGKDILVYIDYTYEGPLGYSASAKIFAFRLEADSSVVNLGEQPYPSRGEWPDIFKFGEDRR